MRSVPKTSLLLALLPAVGCSLPATRVSETAPSRYRICLNGDATLTDAASGRRAPVRVPHTYAEGVEKRFSLPLPDLSGILGDRRALLELESVAGRGNVSVDGTDVASFKNCSFESRAFDVTPFLRRKGVRQLAIVTVPHGAGGKPITHGYRWGNYRYGIKGNLFLHLVPSVRVETVKIETSVRNRTIRAVAWLHNGGDRPVRITWTPHVLRDAVLVLRLPSRKAELPAGGTRIVVSEAPWRDPELWGYPPYGKPVLYTLASTLDADGGGLDARRDTFGFREIRAEGNRILFNGKPAFFRFALLGPMYGSHRRYFTEYFRAFRSIHFDSLRFNIENHTNGHAIFDLADETGFLLKPSLHLAHGRVFHHTHVLAEDEIAEFERIGVKTIRRFWNHPSWMWIVADNEFASGAEANRRALRRLALTFKKTDPTRLIEHGGDPALLPLRAKGGYPEMETWSVRAGTDPKAMAKLLADFGYAGDLPLVNDEMYPGGFLYDDGTALSFLVRNPDLVAVHTAKLGDIFAGGIKGLRALGFQSIGPCIGGGPFFTGIRPGEPVRYLFDIRSDKTVLPVRWPSRSGEDAQVLRCSAGASHGLLNWFDETRPAFHTSVMAAKIRAGLAALGHTTPPIRPTRPEVIVALADAEGAPLADRVVLAGPPGAPVVQGVRTDAAGTAWFVLDRPGRYRIAAPGTGIAARTICVKDRAARRPGYGHVQWFALGNAQARIHGRRTALALPVSVTHAKEPDRKVPAPYTGPRDLVAHWTAARDPENPIGLTAMGARGVRRKTEEGRTVLTFDGREAITVPYPKALDKQHTGYLTLAAWIRPARHDCGILTKRDFGAMPNYRLMLDKEGRLYFGGRFGAMHTGTHTVRATIPLDRWTHVAVTADGAEVRLYVNGRLDIAHPKPGKLKNTRDVFLIGTSVHGRPYAGAVSEIRIYNYPLSSFEVRDLHLQSKEAAWQTKD